MIQNPAIQGGGGEPEMVTGKTNTNAKGDGMYVLVDGRYVLADPNVLYEVPKMSVVIARCSSGAITANGVKYAGTLASAEYRVYLVTDNFTIMFG